MSRLIFLNVTVVAICLTGFHQVHAEGGEAQAPAPAEQIEVITGPQNQDAATALRTVIKDNKFIFVASKLGATAAKVQKVIIGEGTKIFEKLKKAGNKEFNRYNLRYTFDLDGNQLVSSKLHLRGDASYQFQIKPSFVDGEQIRQDIYRLSVGSHDLKLGAQVELRFTFTRTFSGPTAKWDALTNFEFPFNQFWDKVPMNAADFKVKMKDGDMVRVELFGKIGPNFTKEKIKDLRAISAGVELYTEALFAVDAQKVQRTLFTDKQPRARLRFLALKNSGSGRFSFNAGTKEVAKNAPDFIRRIFSIGASFSFLKTLGIREPLPIDSLMVDYLFRFQDDDPRNRTQTSAENAVDEIYANIMSFGFMDLIDPSIPAQKVSDRLLAHASLAERYALEDAQANLGDASRVRHLFKGRLRTNLSKSEVDGELTKFNKMNVQTGNMNSHVTSVDVYGRKSFYILENSFTRDYARRGVANRTQLERIDDYDFLTLSDEKETVGPLLDVVTRTEIKEKKMNRSRFGEVTNSIIRSLPQSFAKENADKIAGFFPKEDQTNGHITYQFNYGDKALKAIGQQLSSDEITLRTYDYILNNPNRRQMYLPFDTHTGDSSPPSYSEYIGPIAKQINIALGANTPNEERLAAVQALKREPLFQQWLMLEFFPSLIPENGAAQNMGLTLQFRSLEHQERDPATRIVPLKVGAAKTSQIYETVIFLRSIINGFDSFDMRLEQVKDKDGHEYVIIQQLKGFKNETNEEENPEDDDEK